jgi:hypothetical protein
MTALKWSAIVLGYLFLSRASLVLAQAIVDEEFWDPDPDGPFESFSNLFFLLLGPAVCAFILVCAAIVAISMGISFFFNGIGNAPAHLTHGTARLARRIRRKVEEKKARREAEQRRIEQDADDVIKMISYDEWENKCGH